MRESEAAVFFGRPLFFFFGPVRANLELIPQSVIAVSLSVHVLDYTFGFCHQADPTTKFFIGAFFVRPLQVYFRLALQIFRKHGERMH